MLTRDAGGGISVTTASLVDAVAFATHSPTIVSSNINTSGTNTMAQTPTQQQQQQQQQGQRSLRGALSDLPITTHFCSSCKKRMPFDAFQRRQNGSLYNTCISCLTRTKQRKGQQARSSNAETSGTPATSGAGSQQQQQSRLMVMPEDPAALSDHQQLTPEAIAMSASNQQGGLASAAAAAAIAAAAANDAQTALQRANLSALDGTPPDTATYSNSTVASLPFARTNTTESDGYRSRRIPLTAAATFASCPDELGITTAPSQAIGAPSIIAAQRALGSQQQGDSQTWSVDAQNQQQATPPMLQSLPIRQTLSAQPASAFGLSAATANASSSLSQLGAAMSTPGPPSAKRFRTSLSVLGSNDRTHPPLAAVAGNGVGDPSSSLTAIGRRDSIGGSIGGLVIPDAYVQLEYQRLELERQRLAMDQERWREERAERLRWEQMYREQWQEEREERKAFREREQHIWKILLTLRNTDPNSNISPSL
ncbi:hypothetical protein GQ54DRAFT_299811 [Martensiomyces pterosporus]|nr:hypothetical protein GQ54DRAFT_299811 [Martensiomyces pterosporus]